MASSLFSCKPKEVAPNTGGYYIRFEIDGEQKEYSKTTAFFSNGRSHVSLNGGSDEHPNDAFTINIYNTIAAPLKSGDTFSVREDLNSPKNVPACYVGYSIDFLAYYFYGSWIAEQNDRAIYPCEVYLTEVTDDYVKGTFSATVRERFGTKTRKMTNGTFYVER